MPAMIMLKDGLVFCRACAEGRRGAGIVLEPGEGADGERCDSCGLPLGRPVRLLSDRDIEILRKGIGSRTERLAGIRR